MDNIEIINGIEYKRYSYIKHNIMPLDIYVENKNIKESARQMRLRINEIERNRDIMLSCIVMSVFIDLALLTYNHKVTTIIFLCLIFVMAILLSMVQTQLNDECEIVKQFKTMSRIINILETIRLGSYLDIKFCNMYDPIIDIQVQKAELVISDDIVDNYKFSFFYFKDVEFDKNLQSFTGTTNDLVTKLYTDVNKIYEGKRLFISYMPVGNKLYMSTIPISQE